MNNDEFLLAIAEANFEKIVGSENIDSFLKYVNKVEEAGQEKIVIRLLLEKNNSIDEIPSPYYMWIVFSLIEESDGAEIYLPDFDVPLTQLENEELKGLEFFPLSEPLRKESR